MRKANGQPLSWSSQTLHLTHVNQFFRYLVKMNHLPFNPAAELELPKQPKSLPKPILSLDEVERVLAQPDTTTALGLRDRAILETFYSSGLRRAELCRLRLDEVDVSRRAIFIRLGKGQKDRYVPVGVRALVWIARYVEHARDKLLLDAKEPTLFLTKDGQPLSPDSLTEYARRYLRSSGVNKAGACHIFRHTMATLMLENGAEIRYLQAILGHERLETTQIYTAPVSASSWKSTAPHTQPSDRTKTPTHPQTRTPSHRTSRNFPTLIYNRAMLLVRRKPPRSPHAALRARGVIIRQHHRRLCASISTESHAKRTSHHPSCTRCGSIGQDPIGFNAGDANLYRCVGNSPTNATDPSGLYDSETEGRLIGDLERAQIADAAYKGRTDKLNLDNWKKLWEYDHEESGFRAVLFGNTKTGKVVLSFAGTKASDLTGDWKANVCQGIGLKSKQYELATATAAEFKKRFGDRLEIVGHSLGGGLASAAALIYEVPATTFNPAGVHLATVARHGKNRSAAEDLIVVYRVRGEILTTLENGRGPIGQLMPDSIGKTHSLCGRMRDPVTLHGMAEVLHAMQKALANSRKPTFWERLMTIPENLFLEFYNGMWTGR